MNDSKGGISFELISQKSIKISDQAFQLPKMKATGKTKKMSKLNSKFNYLMRVD